MAMNFLHLAKVVRSNMAAFRIVIIRFNLRLILAVLVQKITTNNNQFNAEFYGWPRKITYFLYIFKLLRSTLWIVLVLTLLTQNYDFVSATQRFLKNGPRLSLDFNVCCGVTEIYAGRKNH